MQHVEKRNQEDVAMEETEHVKNEDTKSFAKKFPTVAKTKPILNSLLVLDFLVNIYS